MTRRPCPTFSGPYTCAMGDEGHMGACETVQPSIGGPWLGPAGRGLTLRQDTGDNSNERESTTNASDARATSSQDALAVSAPPMTADTAEARLRLARERRERLLGEATQIEAERRGR